MNKKIIFLIALIAIIGIITCLVIKEKQPKIVKVKLINIENYGYVKPAGYFEGELSFVNVNNNDTKYFVSLCRDDWPNFEVNSYYKLNLTELATNIRTNGELAGCYLGNLDLLLTK